jgi:hypothetical protein
VGRARALSREHHIFPRARRTGFSHRVGASTTPRYGAPALTLSWRRCRHSKRRRWKGAWWNHWLDSSRAGDNRSALRHSAVRFLRRFYGRGPSGLRPYNVCIVGRAALPWLAFPGLLSSARPSLCAHEALRRTLGGATMTTVGGTGTTLRIAFLKLTHARPTGFYHRVGVPPQPPP